MNGLYRSLAMIGLLTVAACADTGPTTQSQISQDINSSRWMSSDLLPSMQNDAPRTSLFGNSSLFGN